MLGILSGAVGTIEMHVRSIVQCVCEHNMYYTCHTMSKSEWVGCSHRWGPQESLEHFVQHTQREITVKLA